MHLEQEGFCHQDSAIQTAVADSPLGSDSKRMLLTERLSEDFDIYDEMAIASKLLPMNPVRLKEENEEEQQQHQKGVVSGPEVKDSPPEDSLDTKPVQKTKTYHYNTRGNPIVIRNVIIFAILHALAGLGIYHIYAKKLFSLHIIMLIYGNFGGLGITAGAHRLWAHKAYKAKFPLRVFLMLCNCVAGQNDLHEWVRDHRVHHKFTETDADPHNSHRGYFFSHIGWLMTRKHPEVIIKGKQLDMSDIEADPVIRFQKKYYLFLYFLMAFFLPAFVGHYVLAASWWDSLLIAVFARYCVALHCTWFVNSAAHMWGDQPYDERINPRENIFVSFGALGEGFHNYHHAFPFDYKTSEMGWKFNVSTMFIDAMAAIGQAYDLKTLDKKYIEKRKARIAAKHAQAY